MCVAALTRCSAALLTHVNLLLTLYAGAQLATAARLKWDPSTYIAVRELFALEYRAAAVAFSVVGFAQLALVHVAAIGLRATAVRRVLLLLFAALMVMLMIFEVGFLCWVVGRLMVWAGTEQAAELREALEIRHNLRPILQFLGRWHPLPEHLTELMEEAEADAPRNVYVAIATGSLLVVLQPAAVLLAVLAARAPAHARVPSEPLSQSSSISADEATLLNPIYQNFSVNQRALVV